MSEHSAPVQPTENENYPLLPVILFLVIVGVILVLLLPRPAPRATEEAESPAEVVPTEVAAAPTEAAPAAEAAPTEAAPAAEATAAEPAEAAQPPAAETAGEFDAAAAYNWACASCHGLDARGVPGYASSLLFSMDVMGRNTRALTALLTDPQIATSGEFVHPYRGGYPQLSDEQISQLLDYLFMLTTQAG
ncbi:MAG: hypothetical protein HXY40_00795 [Chloroflexi bacterium]|nr:hypothetical protein [Chloroflexota bacterium]